MVFNRRGLLSYGGELFVLVVFTNSHLERRGTAHHSALLLMYNPEELTQFKSPIASIFYKKGLLVLWLTS